MSQPEVGPELDRAVSEALDIGVEIRFPYSDEPGERWTIRPSEIDEDKHVGELREPEVRYPRLSTDPAANAEAVARAAEMGLGEAVALRVGGEDGGFGGVMQSPDFQYVEYDEDEDGVGLLIMRYQDVVHSDRRKELRRRFPVKAKTREEAKARAILAAAKARA